MAKVNKEARLVGRYVKTLVETADWSPAAIEGYLQGKRWSNASSIARAFEASRADRGAVHVNRTEKSAIGGLGLTSPLTRTEVGQAFLDGGGTQAIIPQLTEVNHAPLYTRLLGLGVGAIGAGRVQDGAAIPVVRAELGQTMIEPLKHAGIFVVTKDLLRNAGPKTEETLGNLVAASAWLSQNRTFMDPALPESALYGALVIASTGSTLSAIDADLRAAIDHMGVQNLAKAVWIISSRTAATLALMRGSGGQRAYPELTVNGGFLAGIPVIVSGPITVGGNAIIALVYQPSIVVSEEMEISIELSQAATLEMNDAPTGNSLAPTPTSQVSMFQTDNVAIRAIIEQGWHATGSANAYISGVTY